MCSNFDLGGPFAHQELQVIDHQQPDAPVLSSETGQAAAAEGFEEVARELLRREVHGRELELRFAPPSKCLPANESCPRSLARGTSAA